MKKTLHLFLLLIIIVCTQIAKAQTPTVNVSYLGDADTIAIQRMAAQPVIKIQINTNGNTSLALEKLVIKTLCEDSTDIDSVAIYSTKKINRFSFADVIYPTDGITLITKRKKFNKDSVIFDNLTYSLDTCYLWVTFDLSKTSKGGRYINAYIKAGGITISAAPYPTTTVMPTKNIIIRQKYFSENFERANNDADVGCPWGTPYGWQIKYGDSNKVKWGISKGGYGNPDVLGQGNPSYAKSGNRNIRFYRQGTYFNRISTLYPTKPIDLTLATKPLLTFYHAQMTWEGQTDTLGLFYQVMPDTTWKYLKGYDYPTPDDKWVKREIVLPDAMAGKKINLGFRGFAHWGWGTCVDSIVIFETQSSSREIKAVDITHPLISYVPQSSTNNPILRVNIRIKGNTSLINLNSLKVTSGNIRDADVVAVKLYSTVDSIFDKQALVGSGSFASGTVTFSSLNHKLESGDNYYWVTYDIASNAIPDDLLDASIMTNDIVTSIGSYPSADASPAGNRIVKQTIFWDDFETDKNWGLRGDFQRGTPMGKGGGGGFPDPTKAYAGSMELGNDLTIDGNYDKNLTNATADTATSPLIPCKYFKNTELNFYRWLNVFNEDSASIDIKYEGESTWRSIWNNNYSLSIIEGSWRPSDPIINSKQVFDRKNFRIRFRLGPTKTINYSGWNIDNLFFTGDSVKWDVAVTQYLSPTSACGLTSSEKFKVKVKNTGPKTLTNIPIKLSIDGGKSWIVSETIPGPLAKDNSIDYSFVTGVDLSKAKIYNVIAKVAYPADNYPDNDSVTYNLVSVPTYSAPYQQGFEKDTSFWSSYGLNNSWLRIESPGNGDYIKNAPEGIYFWKTDMSGSYMAYENSYLESPCFNFTGDSIPLIDFKYSSKGFFKSDGAKMEYSTDGGAIWNYLPKDSYAYPWSWYNDTIHAFHGVKGWTGQTEYLASQIWVEGRQILPAIIANKPNVKFRVNFKTDSINGTNTDDGFAIDDFKLMNAPFDAGVSAINNLTNNANYCQYEKDGIVQVKVKNYGIRNMHTNDTIIIAIKVDNQAAVIDTFKLTSAINANGTQDFTMKKKINIVNVGTHKIKAYTLIEKDPYFYSATSNDADSINVNIKPNPVTNLPVTYSSARPDTLQIKAYQGPNYAYSWEFGGSTVSTTYNVNVKNGAVVRIGDFHLTVTDNTPGNGCVTKDTVTFNLLMSDAGVKKIIDPITNCGYSATFKPIVRIKNFGTDTLRANLALPIQTRLTKGGVVGGLVNDSYTLTNKLVPGDSIDVTLNNIVNLTVPDSYTFMVRTALPNDLTSSNDSSFNSFQIYGYPTIDLGPDIYKKALSYTIKAPAGYNKYLWNDGSGNDSLVVTSTGKYKVTVTNTNLCETSDSVNIMLSIHDLSIKRIISPVTFCTKPGLSTISCKVMNNGSDTIKIAENPVMSYSLNSGTPVTQNLALASNLLPGDSVTFAFTQKEDIHLPSTYNFLIKATVASDLRKANDSVTNVVKVFSNPVINLGTDNIVHALQYKLAPGNNYAGYLWQDNSTDSTFIITQTHKSADNTYSAIVTDGNGCKGGDTIHIYFYVDDLKLDTIDIPNQVCSQPFPVKIKVSNTGSETYVNKDLIIRYTVNNDPEVIEAAKFTGNPNSYSIFTFNTIVTPNQMGANKIKATIEMIGDLRRTNDTLTKAYDILNGINIDFGAVNDTLNVDLPYTLDAGSGTGYSYTWSTAETTQTKTVSSNGIYTVSITNGSCNSSKSVTVIDKIYDLAISRFTIADNPLPLTECKSSTIQAVGIELQNMGTMPLTNQSITVKYQINSGAQISKVVSFTGGKLAKNLFYFDDLLDLSLAVIDTFKVSLTFALDEVSSNDGKPYLLNVLDKPTIIFAGAVNDTIKTSTLPRIIDPGASGTGYTYQWYEGSTTRTISTSLQRWHTVTVNNGYCTSTDSVYLRDLTPVFRINGKTADIIVYPNPVSDVLNVDLSITAGEDVTFEFISSTGAILKTGKLSSNTSYTQTITVADLPKGTYYLRVHRKDWATIEKVIVR